jgi:hypothetical protein
MIVHKYTCDRCQANIEDGLFLIKRYAQPTPQLEKATKTSWFGASEYPLLCTDGIQFPVIDPDMSSFHICKDCNDRLTKFMEPNVK